MTEEKDLKKSLDPVTIVTASAAVVAAYPAAKEIIRDIKNTQRRKVLSSSRINNSIQNSSKQLGSYC